MESISPLYPNFADNQKHGAVTQPMESGEGAAADGQTGSSPHPRITPELNGPSVRTTVPRSPDVSQQKEEHNSLDFSCTAPYSPSRAELESHPIQQRLSVLCENDDDDNDDDDDWSASWSELANEPTAAQDERDLVVGQELLRGEHDEDKSRCYSDTTMTDTEFKKGDAAAYSWGGDKKGGTVQEVAKEGSVTMETARGNTVEKEAKPNDPAVRLEREGHDVVKNASELQKESAGESHNEGGVQKKVDTNGQVDKKKDDEKKENGEAKTGEKRAAEDETPKENGEAPPKKKGRPAKNAIDGVKKAVKKRIPKKAATESGEPRRSGRVAAKSS